VFEGPAVSASKVLQPFVLVATVLLLGFFFANVEIQIEGRAWLGHEPCRPGASSTIGCLTSSGAAGR